MHLFSHVESKSKKYTKFKPTDLKSGYINMYPDKFVHTFARVEGDQADFFCNAQLLFGIIVICLPFWNLQVNLGLASTSISNIK